MNSISSQNLKLKNNFKKIIKKYINAIDKTDNYLDPYLLSKDSDIDHKTYQKLNELEK